MSTIVDTCWGPRPIDDQPYWHLISPSGLFYNNVRVGKGALLSVSAGIEAEPIISSAQTPYSFARLTDEKEAVFEELRQTKYPTRPPRLKTLYAFDEYRLVDRALKEWFPGGQKIVHECRLLLGSVIHRADTAWLNCSSNMWQEYAEKYWQGVMGRNPFAEVLIHGALYFPDWESYSPA